MPLNVHRLFHIRFIANSDQHQDVINIILLVKHILGCYQHRCLSQKHFGILSTSLSQSKAFQDVINIIVLVKNILGCYQHHCLSQKHFRMLSTSLSQSKAFQDVINIFVLVKSILGCYHHCLIVKNIFITSYFLVLLNILLK